MPLKPEPALLAYCRPGFEPELAAELTARAGERDHWGHAATERNSGVVRYVCASAAVLERQLAFDDLIFARQKLLGLAKLDGLDPTDRITPLLAALEDVREPVAAASAVPCASATSSSSTRTATKAANWPASPAASATPCARPCASRAGSPTNPTHCKRACTVLLHSGTRMELALSRVEDSSPWPGGIPRLRQPPNAPSRSAAKLDEAIHTLLTDEERKTLLRDACAAPISARHRAAGPGCWCARACASPRWTTAR